MITCLKKPYSYRIQLPITGYPKDAVESKKQAASLPKPPLPSPASAS